MTFSRWRPNKRSEAFASLPASADPIGIKITLTNTQETVHKTFGVQLNQIKAASILRNTFQVMFVERFPVTQSTSTKESQQNIYSVKARGFTQPLEMLAALLLNEFRRLQSPKVSRHPNEIGLLFVAEFICQLRVPPPSPTSFKQS